MNNGTTTDQPGQVATCGARTEPSFKRTCHGVLAGLGFCGLLLVPVSTLAQEAPDLGSTSTFG